MHHKRLVQEVGARAKGDKGSFETETEQSARFLFAEDCLRHSYARQPESGLRTMPGVLGSVPGRSARIGLTPTAVRFLLKALPPVSGGL